MDTPERLHTELLDSVQRAVGGFNAYRAGELRKQHYDSQRKQDSLQRQIAALTARCETFDALLTDNHRLKKALLQRHGNALLGSSFKPEHSRQNDENTLNVVGSIPEQGSTGRLLEEEQMVSISQFKALQMRCETYARELSAANELGKRYRDTCQAYKTRRQQDKIAIKSWQAYHDRLIARSRDAGQELSSLLSEISLGSCSIAGSIPHTPHSCDHGTGDQNASGLQIIEGSIEQGCPPWGDGITAKVPSTQAESNRAVKPQPRPGGFIAPDVRALLEQKHERCTDDGTSPTKDTELIAANTETCNDLVLKEINSSQSTEGEVQRTEPSRDHKRPRISATDEVVEFVSSRSLKRKRASVPQTPAVGLRDVPPIKIESDSSPMEKSALVKLTYQETMDLDQVSRNYTTPRKDRWKKMRYSAQSKSSGARQSHHPQHERSRSLPAGGTQHSALSDSFESHDVGFSFPNAEEAYQVRPQDPKHSPSGDKPPRLSGICGPGNTSNQNARSGKAEPLRSLDVNQPLFSPRAGTVLYEKGQRTSRGEISELAEDGEVYSASRASSAQCTVNFGVLTMAEPGLEPKRLNVLLENKSSPNRHRLTHEDFSVEQDQSCNRKRVRSIKQESLTSSRISSPRPKTINEKYRVKAQSSLFIPAKSAHTEPPETTHPAKDSRVEDVTVIGGDRLQGVVSFDNLRECKPAQGRITPKSLQYTNRFIATPATIPKPTRMTKSLGPEVLNAPMTSPTRGTLKTPLRSRRFQDLNIDDFRINSAANEGLDYAFTDTVRNREARQCFPGCTRTECCGDRFRKMASIGGAPAITHGLWDAISSQLDPDDRLLREYMGHNAPVLASMTREQRQEALLKAKAAQLAGTFGRHKAQWQRSRTPPGFWRTDFPSTQETEGDKEESKRREQEEVEERYREAMKRGGKWKFADE